MKHNKFKFLGLVIFALLSTVVNGQIEVSRANLGQPGSPFFQACADEGFNTYFINFSFTPASNLQPNNQFILELSDAEGSFTNATVVFTSDEGSITTSPAVISFSLPTDTAGDAYRVRVRSTAPEAEGNSSNAFPAYYKIHDSPIIINDLEETAQYCAGGSYLLTIDNPPEDSPLQFPSLTFNWFRRTGPTTSDFVASGATLAVSTPGTYFVETNYGPCTSQSISNEVTVSQSTTGGGGSVSITSSLGNPFCSQNGATTLSTMEGGNTYRWFKDGIEVESTTANTFMTDESGIFDVEVDFGDCTSTGQIVLDNNDFTSEIDVLEAPEINTIDQGESLEVNVTTSATNPEFKWYLNDTEISGENTNTYQASSTGSYRVEVIQTNGCLSSDNLFFNVNVRIEPFPDVGDKIPNVVTSSGDNNRWIIPLEFVSGTNTNIMIISERGEVVLDTNEYQNDWPGDQLDFKDISPVFYYIITTQDQKTKKGSITVLR